MAEPLAGAVKRADFSVAQIDGKERHGDFLLEALIEQDLALFGKGKFLALGSPNDLTGRRPAHGARGARPLVKDADGQRLVGVDGGQRSSGREFRELAGRERVKMRGPDRAIFGVVDLPRLAADLESAAPAHAVDEARDDQFDFAGFEIDGGETAGRSENHLIAFGREWILVEIEAGTFRLAGEPHHPMARGGFDPFGGRFGGENSVDRRKRDDQREECERPGGHGSASEFAVKETGQARPGRSRTGATMGLRDVGGGCGGRGTVGHG